MWFAETQWQYPQTVRHWLAKKTFKAFKSNSQSFQKLSKVIVDSCVICFIYVWYKCAANEYESRVNIHKRFGYIVQGTRDKYDPKHDDVIKSEHFPRYWPFVRGIHRSSTNPQRPVTRTFDVFFVCFFICAWTNQSLMVEQTIEIPVISDAIALIVTPLQCYMKTLDIAVSILTDLKPGAVICTVSYDLYTEPWGLSLCHFYRQWWQPQWHQ